MSMRLARLSRAVFRPRSQRDAGVVQKVLELATHGRRLIVSVEAPAGVGPELNLLSEMDRIAVMEGSAVVAVGPPAEVNATQARARSRS
jgi:hypothetical protein